MRKELSPETIESLARVTDHLMYSVAETYGISDNYLNSLVRIGEYVEEGLYEVAIEMLMQNAVLLDKEAYSLIDDLIYSDYEATDQFLEYYYEHLLPGYELEKSFKERLKELEEDEENSDEKAEILNEAFDFLKGLLEMEVSEDEGCKSCCNM